MSDGKAEIPSWSTVSNCRMPCQWTVVLRYQTDQPKSDLDIEIGILPIILEFISDMNNKGITPVGFNEGTGVSTIEHQHLAFISIRGQRGVLSHEPVLLYRERSVKKQIWNIERNRFAWEISLPLEPLQCQLTTSYGVDAAISPTASRSWSVLAWCADFASGQARACTRFRGDRESSSCGQEKTSTGNQDGLHGWKFWVLWGC